MSALRFGEQAVDRPRVGADVLVREFAGTLVGDGNGLLPGRGIDLVEDRPAVLPDGLLVGLADLLEHVSAYVHHALLAQALRVDLLEGADQAESPVGDAQQRRLETVLTEVGEVSVPAVVALGDARAQADEDAAEAARRGTSRAPVPFATPLWLRPRTLMKRSRPRSSKSEPRRVRSSSALIPVSARRRTMTLSPPWVPSPLGGRPPPWSAHRPPPRDPRRLRTHVADLPLLTARHRRKRFTART